MKNLFIQHFINEAGQTFLDVGEADGKFESIPSQFDVTGTGVWITIAEKDWERVTSIWPITQQFVNEQLDRQFGNGHLEIKTRLI